MYFIVHAAFMRIKLIATMTIRPDRRQEVKFVFSLDLNQTWVGAFSLSLST